ncbi:uncharacterized protein GIQ15_04550 [Arthroderma uncinatum]|uniref:uncharacterized protein n=1 Tax=Arthroderma uncinatum TaxID=74035 RepID=UPI00144A6619|nr:uncharacterized protein GIQ15_04550 [Arthroderma uncinatum]KAF3481791.1 hypothetical protein GIQ15_04550 [Arthroderma uncinatum]
MPIKIPGFGRRKSSGNTLDETTAPTPAAEPSFRVFERPSHRASHSFDSVTALKQSAARPRASEDPDPDNIFAGIEKPAPATTTNTASHINGRNGKLNGSNGSSSKPYDNSSASSARYSSSSTLPSSTDHSPHDGIPVPPIPESPFAFSIRASGRTFSFGSKASKTSIPRKSESTNRERAMTNSTTSTATPPKLMETDLNLEGAGEMGNIFEGVGVDKRRSRVLDNITNLPQPGRPAPSVPAKDKRVSPSPLSPLSSNHSQTSRDSLIAADDYTLSQQLASQLRDVELSEPSPKPRAAYMPNSRSTPNIYSSERERNTMSPPLRDPEVSSLFSSDKDFTHVPRHHHHSPLRQNHDSNGMAANASLASRYEASLAAAKPVNKVMTPAQFERYQQQQAQRAPSEHSSDEEDEVDSEDDEDEAEKRKQAAAQRKKQEAHLSVYRQQMMKITGEQKKSNINDAAGSSESITHLTTNQNRRSVLDPMETTTTTASTSPGLSPGLFPGAGPAKSTPSDGDDDDDVPLGILAAHGFPHRNRPPSHLALSRSNPNLNAAYQAGPASIAGTPDGAPSGSTKRSTLPVFARNLPKDPYFGASLVNPSHRESLALGGGAPGVNLNTVNLGPPGLPPGGLVGVIASEERARAMRRGSPNAQGVYDMGMPQMHNTNFLTPQPQMQMGGLLGQLQQQQQAQAAQGGLPNGMHANGLIGQAGTVNPHHHHHPFPQAGSVGSPADQTQMQVSQQMTQMMQVQMQWMQQMMQMQGTQAPGQQQQMPPFPGQMPGQMPMQIPAANPNASTSSLLQPPNPNQRPFSMVSNPSHYRGPPQVDHRTLSMLDPSTSGGSWAPGQMPGNRASFLMTPDMGGPSLGMGLGMGGTGYAPSVAPSERSNIGAASRYRPVSTIAQQSNSNAGANRSSTFTTSTLRPWTEERPPPIGLSAANKSNTNLSTITPSTSETTPTIRPVSSMFRRLSPLLGGNSSRASVAGLPTPAAGAGDEDEDDEKAWAEMMKNREKKKTGWKFRRGGGDDHAGTLGDYVHPTAI